MRIKMLCFGVLLLPASGIAQTELSGQFGCSQRMGFDAHPTLKFVEPASRELIRQWRAWPAFAFDGFEGSKYGFTRAEFYRWRVPPPAQEGTDQSDSNDSTDRVELAVRLLGPRGERWFELASPAESLEGLVDSQPRNNSATNGIPAQAAKLGTSTPQPDEMTDGLTIEPATSDSVLPLFRVSYRTEENRGHQSGGYLTEEITIQMLLDLRTGTPQIIKSLSCYHLMQESGSCSALEEESREPDNLQCQWDVTLGDFRCVETGPYGNHHAARTGQKDFYLLSEKPAKPIQYNLDDFLPDAGELAVRIRDNPKSQARGVPVLGLGPTTLLQRFEDLLPGTEIFVFASPGAGDLLNAHLSLVTLHASDTPTIQTISKWDLAGAENDEEKAPEGFIPVNTHDAYHSQILEQRPGFRAFNVVLIARPDRSDAVHIVYWVGLEAVDGKPVANAVRLASEGLAYGECATAYQDGTASFIKKKAGTTEATVRVQGRYNPERKNPYPEGQYCVWTGFLHWKAGEGFRVRKLNQDCTDTCRRVKITDEGVVSAKDDLDLP
jgi:hypothetical protein